MRYYLENHKFYVLNESEKLVYKVGEYEAFHDSQGIHIHLELVAGWGYINPDENDIQGWCPANKFVEDMQSEMVFQYFLVEGMKEALQENGYTVLDKISPSLQFIINKHNEA